MRDFRLLLSLLIACCLALSIAACGGDDNDGSSIDCSQMPATTANPIGGSFPLSESPSVTLTTNKPAIIYYSLDGETPIMGRRNTYKGSSPIPDIPITTDSILLYFAEDACGNQESVKSQVYQIDESPTSSASPSGGTYTAPVDVLIEAIDDTLPPAEGELPLDGCADASVIRIFWTTDGTTPAVVDDGAGTLVAQGSTEEGSSPLHILVGGDVTVNTEGSITLQYFSVDCFNNTERVRTENYRIDRRAPITSATPAGGVYTGSTSVTLQTDEVATIYYTLDGSPPSSDPDDEIVYGGNTYRREQIAYVTIAESTVLKYFSIDRAGNIETIKTDEYVIE
jgi:Chitobiase/beta-hexosaminidase C-terminal domain